MNKFWLTSFSLHENIFYINPVRVHRHWPRPSSEKDTSIIPCSILWLIIKVVYSEFDLQSSNEVSAKVSLYCVARSFIQKASMVEC